jgi:hypothetical protein
MLASRPAATGLVAPLVLRAAETGPLTLGACGQV